jgi:glyoxylase-like metal-dependent hydrolase (beta-lactamase superfamily II)
MGGLPDANLIDVLQTGRERVIGAWDLGGAIVDPGPESRIEKLLAELTESPRALLLTHVHLDHAGATGALVERFPDLEVYVHARGAPHLIDPSRLLASATRLYGNEMGPLWGRVLPVPERNITALEGGERLHVAGRDFAVEYAPGHAYHHVVYCDGSDGTAYVGDVAGVRIPPSDFVRPPTPPPDIDVEEWQRTIDTVEQHGPARLALTHFGAVEDPGPHLAQMRTRLDDMAQLVRSLLDEHGDTPEAVAAFVAEMRERAAAASQDGSAAVLEVGAPIEQTWAGMRRYWMKRAEAVPPGQS